MQINMANAILKEQVDSLSEVTPTKQAPLRFQKTGRAITTLFNLTLLFLVIVFCVCMNPEQNQVDWGPFYIALDALCYAMFILLFCALTATVVVLISKLKRSDWALEGEEEKNNFFKQEITTLSLILLFFSVSYLLRACWDFAFGFLPAEHGFSFYLLAALASFPFDLLPICTILLLHRRNLCQSNLVIQSSQSESSPQLETDERDLLSQKLSDPTLQSTIVTFPNEAH